MLNKNKASGLYFTLLTIVYPKQNGKADEAYKFASLLILYIYKK